MSTVLYRKYRARKFADIRGQDTIVRILTNAILQSQVAHAYLFAGPRGTGKTSTARLLAKAVNSQSFTKLKDIDPEDEISKLIEEGNYLDLIEIDAASNRGIEEIRQIKESVNYRPSQGAYKVFIIDEVHMLTREAFNALLKTLEEPPKHIIFVLATTEPHKVPDTILSRVQRFDFRLATRDELRNKLEHILESEQLEAETEALDMIFDHTSGSYRDAESILGKILMENPEVKKLKSEHVKNTLGLAPSQQVFSFIEGIVDGNLKASLEQIESLAKEGVNLKLFLKQVSTSLRDSIVLTAEKGTLDKAKMGLLRRVLQTTNEFRYVDDTQVIIELMILEACGQSNNTTLKQSETSSSSKKSRPTKPEMKAKTSHKPGVKNYSNKWNALLAEVRKQDFKLWAYLKSVEAVEEAGVLTINSPYKNALDQIQSGPMSELLSTIIKQIYSANIVVEYKVQQSDPGSVPLTNEDMVEALF